MAGWKGPKMDSFEQAGLTLFNQIITAPSPAVNIVRIVLGSASFPVFRLPNWRRQILPNRAMRPMNFCFNIRLLKLLILQA